MLSFPNAKINLGLHVISKRKDGYHNIDTVFYPVEWCDALEIVEASNKPVDYFNLEVRGALFPGNVSNNLCYKAFALLKSKFDLPSIEVFLQKCIPSGAGLGGGSSDAAETIVLINKIAGLNLTSEQLAGYAAELGSDCSFFLINKPVRAAETGSTFYSVDLSLKQYYIIVVMPPFTMDTSEAYSLIRPSIPDIPLESLIMLPVSNWKYVIKNDFEEVVFNKYPTLKSIKETLYKHDAVYASMSGSGTAVFGLFERKTDLRQVFKDCKVWSGKAMH